MFFLVFFYDVTKEMIILHCHLEPLAGAGETKTSLNACFMTTGEDHLMSGNGSDREFSGRVTEATQSVVRRI